MLTLISAILISIFFFRSKFSIPYHAKLMKELYKWFGIEEEQEEKKLLPVWRSAEIKDTVKKARSRQSASFNPWAKQLLILK